MDKDKNNPNIIHNDIHDNAGPIFCGVVYQPTFVQPGANLTQNIVNKNDAKDAAEETDLSDSPESNEEPKDELTNDKKIAIFSGCILGNIPTTVADRDLLYEQLFPINYWGTDFVVTRSLEKENVMQPKNTIGKRS